MGAPLNRVYLVKFDYDSRAYFTGVPLGCSTGVVPGDDSGAKLRGTVDRVDLFNRGLNKQGIKEASPVCQSLIP